MALVTLLRRQLATLLDPLGATLASGSGSGAANVEPPGTPAGNTTYSPGIIVSRRWSAPADWEVANKSVVIDTVPPPNGFTQLIAGVLNQQIVVLSLFALTNNGAGLAVFGNFMDDSGAVVLSRYTQQQVYTVQIRGPIVLPVSQGLRVTNATAVAANSVIGGVAYRMTTRGT